jgi:type IV pilus assembly protein PilF
LLVALVALMASGCAVNSPAASDLPTASDQTQADRLAQVRLELAAAYYSRRQYLVALDEVKRALDARPDLPEALNVRGLIYSALGELRLAESSFQRALELTPQDGDVLHNYGGFLCEQRRFDEADALFVKALGLPRYRGYIRTMAAQADCQVSAGQLRRAYDILSRASELDPGNMILAFRLARVTHLMGEYERARAYIRRVNVRAETTTAESLWLAIRIEHRLGNKVQVDQMSQELRKRFPQSPEALLSERGRFDD